MAARLRVGLVASDDPAGVGGPDAAALVEHGIELLPITSIDLTCEEPYLDDVAAAVAAGHAAIELDGFADLDVVLVPPATRVRPCCLDCGLDLAGSPPTPGVHDADHLVADPIGALIPLLADRLRRSAGRPGLLEHLRVGPPPIVSDAASWAEAAWALAAGGPSRDARQALEQRLLARAERGSLPARLAALRGGREVAWTEADAANPLVTVVIDATAAEPGALARTLAAVRAQSHAPIEIVVVAAPGAGRATSEAVDAACRIVEPVAGAGDPYEAGFAVATGAWIAPIPAGTEPDAAHVELLRSVALEHGLELVYGQAFASRGSFWVAVGRWPPAPGHVVPGTELMATALRVLRPSVPATPAVAEPSAPDAGGPLWPRWAALVDAGARIANIEAIVARISARPAA